MCADAMVQPLGTLQWPPPADSLVVPWKPPPLSHNSGLWYHSCPCYCQCCCQKQAQASASQFCCTMASLTPTGTWLFIGPGCVCAPAVMPTALSRFIYLFFYGEWNSRPRGCQVGAVPWAPSPALYIWVGWFCITTSCEHCLLVGFLCLHVCSIFSVDCLMKQCSK